MAKELRTICVGGQCLVQAHHPLRVARWRQSVVHRIEFTSQVLQTRRREEAFCNDKTVLWNVAQSSVCVIRKATSKLLVVSLDFFKAGRRETGLWLCHT